MNENELKALRGQLAELDAAEVSARSAADALLAKRRGEGVDFASERGAEALSELNEAYKAADGAKARAADLRAVLAHQVAEGGAANLSAPAQRAAAVASLGEAFVRSAEYAALRSGTLLNSASTRVHTQPTEVASRDAMVEGFRARTTFDASAGAGLRTPDYTNILVEQYARQVRLLDVVNVGRTDTDVIDYVTEGTRTDAAAETAFGTALPESAYSFSHNTTTVKRAGHFVPATRGILADAGQTRTLLDSRLLSGLERRLEAQVFNGDGIGENLLGFMRNANIIEQARGTDTQLDAIHKAMTAIRVATEGAANITDIMIHPNDYQDVVLTKTAEGVYIFGSPAGSVAPSIWGLRPVVTTLVSEGTPVIGDFRAAVTVWMREGISILASTEHSDFFLKGLVAVKAETRLATACIEPKRIAKVTTF